jgi:hypothetical protein
MSDDWLFEGLSRHNEDFRMRDGLEYNLISIRRKVEHIAILETLLIRDHTSLHDEDHRIVSLREGESDISS